MDVSEQKSEADAGLETSAQADGESSESERVFKQSGQVEAKAKEEDMETGTPARTSLEQSTRSAISSGIVNGIKGGQRLSGGSTQTLSAKDLDNHSTRSEQSEASTDTSMTLMSDINGSLKEVQDKVFHELAGQPSSPSVQSDRVSRRPSSLPTPDTPSAPSSQEPSKLNGNGFEPAESERWRDSVAEGSTTPPLETITLTNTSPPASPASTRSNRDSVQSFHTFAEAGPSTPSSSSMMAHFSSSRQSINDASGVARRPSLYSDSSNYDLLMHRVESQNAKLKEDPKAKRKSLLGHADIKATFDKLRTESKHKRAESEDLSTVDESGQTVIDWDFWGAIMGDYEKMAKTRRTSNLHFSLLLRIECMS